jgi:phosphoserine phosphatase RsbU/P
MESSVPEWVEIWHAGISAGRVALDRPRLLIGRVAGVDIQLDHGSVSRRHAELVRDPFGRMWIHDLGSRNGTRLNGEVTTQAVVRAEDVIDVGEYTLRLGGAEHPRLEQRPRGAELTTVDTYEHDVGIRVLETTASAHLSARHRSDIMALGERLVAVADAAERLRLLSELMVSDEFRGMVCMALRVSRQRPQMPQVLCVAKAAGSKDRNVSISLGVLRAILEREQPVLAGQGQGGPELMDVMLTQAGPAEGRPSHSVIAFPLDRSEGELEVLYVVLPATLGTQEWLALIWLAVGQYRQAESAWEARQQAEKQGAIERELERARAIQQQFLPRDVSVPGLDFALEFRPSLWVGGDYADVLPLAGGRTLLVVADVAGKGLHAAMIAAALHAMLHALAGLGIALPEMVQTLNRYLCARFGVRSFVTMALVAVDVENGELECAIAGHPPPILVGRDGSVRPLPGGADLPLGIQPTTYSSERCRLEPGEWLAMISDGLSEIRTRPDHLLGFEELGLLIGRACAGCSDKDPKAARGVAQRLMADLSRLADEGLARDDQTLLLARRVTPSP